MAHAANYAKDFVKDDLFMLMYGDILVDPIIYKEVLEKFRNSRAEGLISLIEVKNPEVFGIISLDSNDFVKKITEKPSPELGLGNLANAGIFIFDPLIFKAIEKTEKSIRDEYEFTACALCPVSVLFSRRCSDSSVWAARSATCAWAADEASLTTVRIVPSTGLLNAL